MTPQSSSNQLLANVAKYGVGSLIGLYLTFQLAQGIPAIKDQITVIAQNQNTMKQQHEAMIAIIEHVDNNIVAGIRQICLNGARTRDAINNCLALEAK